MVLLNDDVNTLWMESIQFLKCNLVSGIKDD